MGKNFQLTARILACRKRQSWALHINIIPEENLDKLTNEELFQRIMTHNHNRWATDADRRAWEASKKPKVIQLCKATHG